MTMAEIVREFGGARVVARSILEYADLCEIHPFRTKDIEPKWRGAKSHKEALRMAREGSPEHRELMVKGLEAVRPFTVYAPQHVRRRDVAGDHPDMGRAAAGDPLSMWRRAKRDVAVRPVSRWLVHMGANSFVEASARVNRGAAILALLDSVERAGVRVELELVMKAHGVPDVKYWDSRVMVKEADQPLDLDVVAFALVCPAIHRWLDFGLRNGATGRSTGIVGGTIEVDPAERDERVYFAAVNENDCWNHPDTAAATVRANYEAASGNKLDALT
jgi:hypothetical protein